MRTFSNNFAPLEAETSKEPRFVYQQSWDAADTDHTYFTSGSEAQTPVGADVVASVFQSVTGQTQKINPDIATSTIGAITVKLVDTAEAVNDKIAAKLALLSGMRGKIGRVYVGYYGIPFSDYDLRVTFVVDSVSYLDGVYSIKLSDLQRSAKKNIFAPHEVTLNKTVSATATVIPVTGSDLALFPTVEHGSEYTTRPGETLSYAKCEDEVFAHTGQFIDATLGPSFAVIERGALNTRAVEHVVDADKEDGRKPKITEHIFLEGAAPKIIYALYTGVLVGQAGTLPDHWHLGIDTAFVRLSDFQSLGVDYWNTSDDSGRFVRIENPGSQSGKKFIEKEMLLWLGAFSPIYADGSVGIRRLTQVLSESSHNVALGAHNVKSYSGLMHNMNAVINSIEVLWNFVDAKDDFTKTTALIDAVSIAIHGAADVKKYEFKAVHTGLHTDEDLLTYLDVLRDRYSGPPLSISVEVLPSLSMLEVGDTVRLTLPQVRDFNTGTTLDRAFEVQQVSTNWMTGDIRLSLFGSSMKAGELARTTLSSVLNDSYYTDKGTELSTVLTIVGGAVTANGTLTGHATDVDNAAAIYYYDGDLTIDAGVTVSITENVQLRIKGSLQVNGQINGVGAGATGGVATTLFKNGTTSYNFNVWSATDNVPRSSPAYNEGEGGYFGTTVSPGNLVISRGWLSAPAHANASVGQEMAVPFYQLTNRSAFDLLSGYPGDLRGKSGISGEPFISQSAVGSFFATGEEILANGGAGGNGGAGLLVIARGMAYGGSGTINLSGGDSAAGTGYTYPADNYHPEYIFHGSSGAPGAPGAFMLLLDGNAANPEIDDSNFIASYGDTVTPAGATEVGFAKLVYPEAWFPSWPYSSSVYNLAPYNATELISCTAAAHRVIYVPPAEVVESDVSNFPVLGAGEYKNMFFHQAEGTPIVGNAYGALVDITNDLSRFAVYAQGAPDEKLYIVRSITNPATEFTVTDTGSSGFSSTSPLSLSRSGDRVMLSGANYSVGAVVFGGAVYIYKRSGVTWSLEQRILPATHKDSGHFGRLCAVDKLFNVLIAVNLDGINQDVQFWVRAGSTWSYINSLPDPAVVGASYAQYSNALSLSGDGNYAIMGDYDSAEGGAGVGGVHVWLRTGTTWAVDATLIPDAAAAHGWGRTRADISEDGSVIVFSSGTTVNSKRRVAVYYRQGSTYTLIQIISNPDEADLLEVRSISAGGRVLVVQSQTNVFAQKIYRRFSASEKFSLTQTLLDPNSSIGAYYSSSVITESGNHILNGDESSDVGAYNTGAVQLLQFTPSI